MTEITGLAADDPRLTSPDNGSSTAYKQPDGTYTLIIDDGAAVGAGSTGGAPPALQPLTEQLVTEHPLIADVPLAQPTGSAAPGSTAATSALVSPAIADPNELRLVVGGVSKTGWQSVLVVRGIEIMPSQFAIALTERSSGDSAQVDIKAGDPCQVFIGADLVLTGRVDRVRRRIGRQGCTVQIVGRSKCRELVDCSIDPAKVPNMQISSASVLDITKKLAGIYDVPVQALGGVGGTIIQQFSLNLGEQPYPVIERMARYAQILVYDEVDGSLNLAPVGTGSMASGVAEGVNVEAADGEEGVDQRYSDYEVYLTSVQSLTEIAPITPLTVVKDETVPQFRKLILISEQDALDPTITQRRGSWERNRRFGRSNPIRVTIDSWRDRAGALWKINTLCQVDVSHLKVVGKKWLIAQVAFRRDASGTHADLLLMPPEAFQPEPLVQVASNPEIANARAASSK